jgi:hypothetical protein
MSELTALEVEDDQRSSQWIGSRVGAIRRSNIDGKTSPLDSHPVARYVSIE